MTPSLLGGSWLAVRQPPVLLPVAVAAVLVAASAPWQDSGHAPAVLDAVTFLLACALAATFDEPSAEVASAAPVARRTRTLCRVLLGLAVTVPVFAAAVVVAELRFEPTHPLLAGATAAGFGVVAAATGAVLRACGVPAPAYPAVIGLVALWFVLSALPRGWVLIGPQPWGPPLEAALVRWLAVAVVAVGLLALALRDPAEGPRPGLRARGRARSAPS